MSNLTIQLKKSINKYYCISCNNCNEGKKVSFSEFNKINALKLPNENISTNTFFLYEKIDNFAQTNWHLYKQNKKGSIYNYYSFLG